MLRPGGHHCPVVVAVSRSTRPPQGRTAEMDTTTGTPRRAVYERLVTELTDAAKQRHLRLTPPPCCALRASPARRALPYPPVNLHRE